MKKLISILTAMALFHFTFNSHAAIVYVDINATGLENGMDWMNAYNELFDALANATAGDEIWIADGLYKPTNLPVRTYTFEIPSGVSLYGGFNGSETLRNQRDWKANSTILSGGIGGPEQSDNSYQIIKIVDATESIVIDGLKIQRAYDVGGGSNIFVLNCADVTFTHCVFRYNEVGALDPFYFDESNIEFEDCLFRDNTGNSRLFRIANNAIINFTNVTISDNVATRIVHSDEGLLNLYNCIVYHNDVLDAPIGINEAENCVMEYGEEGIEFPEMISNEDPLFNDPINFDYTIQVLSPAIDWGNSSLNSSGRDLSSNVRVFGDSVDAGAYENQVEISFCEGDADQNGSVDILDVLAVSSNYNCTANCLLGDANADGSVNITDILSISSNFGNTCP